MKRYPISKYNKYICLKANAVMAVIALYLLKPYLIAAASVIYRGHNSALNVFYPDKLIASFEAFAAIPMIFLLYAWTRRAPDATKMIQYICRKGKILIMTTAFLQLCATSIPLWLPVNYVMTRSSWVQLSLCILIIIITAFSTYMRDCFADFPEHHQDDI